LDAKKWVSWWRRTGKPWLVGLLLLGALWLIYAISDEVQNSRLQARWLASTGRQLSFKVGPGPSPSIRFPGPNAGPYDERLGYAELPKFIHRLGAQGYAVSAQARQSARMLELGQKGLFIPYQEKDHAGLTLLDCHGGPLYAALYPERTYPRFEEVPRLLVDSLLYIENRELLDAGHPTRNPAVEWDRFTKAAVDQARNLVGDAHRTAGGSTLATQIEKYRHSPEGRTDSGKEKLRQMASASLRAYLGGENTEAWRQHLVVSYLNTVPLSAKVGFGEVNGLGDGLWAWYGRDFEEVNRLLAQPVAAGPMTLPPRKALAFKQAQIYPQALAFKQALSLMIAQRRPSYYLAEGEPALAQLTDSYLRVMADAGVIPPALRDAALPLKLKLQTQPTPDDTVSFVERKAATALRSKLTGLLDIPRAYDLDRLDLLAGSSLDGEVQRTATQLLRGLKDPAAAKEAGLYGFRLLNEGDDTSKIVFSFTLFERAVDKQGRGMNLLRVQTDNVDQPFDLNEGARLDLGSTSKLRTMVTYLELIAEMHARWSTLDPIMLAAQEVHPKDQLGRWARDWLLHAEDKSLKAMLEAAMERSYSGNPGETFFTGGGAHHFVNFEREEDFKSYSVREAIKHSVNLSFIRIMRDIVYHVMAQSAKAKQALLDDPDDPARREYLARFADKEGKEFLARFWRKYQGKSAEEAEALMLQQRKSTPVRLAAAFYGLEPEADAQDLAEFLARHLGAGTQTDAALQALHDKYGPERWSLGDRGYIAGIHPLELWLVGYLRHHPGASLNDAVAASKEERQVVYEWLFKTRHKGAQDSRIRNLIEQEAFVEVHKRWKRLGYPFETLTPSYASALGASGDRPAALAELMGIIVNHGLRLPVVRMPAMQFARGTPYETRLDAQAVQGERVLPAEVADTVRDAIIGVVEEGTAKRLKGVFKRADGTVVPAGGKTGTGDHRFDTYGPGGRLVSSRVVNRTATLVFFIGDRYFGTMMAYVHEPYAARYKFTSAMPSQLLKALAPALLPLLEEERTCRVAR